MKQSTKSRYISDFNWIMLLLYLKHLKILLQKRQPENKEHNLNFFITNRSQGLIQVS